MSLDARDFAIADDALAPDLIEHRAVVSAPVDVVWSLWSTGNGLRAWLSPNATIELRPGGAFEILFLMDAPAGARGSEGCRVLSFVPGEMLSFSWNAPPMFVDERDRHTWVVVELAPAEGGTEVRLRHLGWPESGLKGTGRWTEVFAYFQAAWGRVLDGLTAHCAARPAEDDAAR